jgi:type I restriction enzyme M protein
VFWVPKEARWWHLQANAKQPSIGKLIDEAILRIFPFTLCAEWNG